MTRVLIVDPDPVICETLSQTLRDHGYDTATAVNASEALEALAAGERGGASRRPNPFGVIITDLNPPDASGDDFLRELREAHPDLVVVVITAYGTIESAVAAIKHGAFDYLTHPIVEEELIALVERAANHGALIAQNDRLKRELDDRYGLDNIVGRDPRMQRIYDLIEAVAPAPTTVLMNGESGTGKSLIARAIHQRSSVSDGPFVEISCGSIPDTLLESELFGHVKGAFTGAHADKVGKFLAADGGTIFLDEINSASPGMQLKLLRVLQERKFEPVGSTETVSVNVRVILASNQRLEALVEEGRFRQDLYFRINVLAIELPPLRDRAGDIPLLADAFLQRYAEKLDRRIAGFSDDATAALVGYHYPGNVRELENIIERAAVLCRRGMIGVEDLPPQVVDPNHDRLTLRLAGAGVDEDDLWDGEPLSEAMDRQERRILLLALEEHEWNRQRTSEALGINRTTLYKKMKQHGLDQLPQAG
ncbi:MAG: sigma-54-dependent transcriptional regulator [Phycisphaerales bacterium]